MKLDWALLANHAEVQNGLVYINGGAIDTVNALQVPAAFMGSLAMRFTLHPTEMNQPHNVEIRIMSEDGQQIAQVSGQTQGVASAAPVLPRGWDAGALLSFNLVGLQLPRFGFYSIEILLDGSHVKSLPFRVINPQGA